MMFVLGPAKGLYLAVHNKYAEQNMRQKLKKYLSRYPLLFTLLKKIYGLAIFFIPDEGFGENWAVFLFGNIPGTLGILVRRWVWSFLFKKVGNNLTILPGVRILGAQNMTLGDSVVLWYGASLFATHGGRLSLGSSSGVYGAIINASRSSIEIGDYCLIAPGVAMRSTNHNYENPDVPIVEQGSSIDSILIGRDVWVAANVSILPGAVIGDGCVIAAGAVVTRGNIPPYSVVGGVPARVIKKREKQADK